MDETTLKLILEITDAMHMLSIEIRQLKDKVTILEQINLRYNNNVKKEEINQ